VFKVSDDLLKCLLSDRFEVAKVYSHVVLPAAELLDLEPNFVVVVAAYSLDDIGVFRKISVVDASVVS